LPQVGGRQIDAPARCSRKREPCLVGRVAAERMNVAQIGIRLSCVGLVDGPGNVAAAVRILSRLDVKEGGRYMVLITENLVVLAEVFVICRGAGKCAGVASASGRWMKSARRQGDVGIRVCRKHGRCSFIQQVGGDAVQGWRDAIGAAIGSIDLYLGSGRVDLEGICREIAQALGCGRCNSAGKQLPDNLAETGIADEEECFIPLDGAAEYSTKIVAMIRQLDGRAPREGVEVRIAIEFEQRCVKRIRS
jgi:hypothetical protein